MEAGPVTLTLDEFMAKRNEARAILSTHLDPSAKQKVASTTEADFSGLRTKENDEADLLVLGQPKASKSRKDQRSTSKKSVADVAFKFQSESQGGEGGGRGGEGGRGGGRESAGRGGARGGGRGGRGGEGGRSQSSASTRTSSRSGGPIIVNDDASFPSLN